MPRKTTNAIVIYARVSTDEQSKSGLGIEAQIEMCRSVCERFGYSIAGIFKDLGVSGKVSPLQRDGFQQAVATTKKAKGRIMVAKLDRLSRNLHHATGFLDEVYDCPPILVAENPTASMLELRMKALFAQEERDAISRRTREALAARKARGCPANGTAGREAHSAKAQELTKDAIATALELKAKGLSLQAIADTLNEEGYTTSRGTKWSKQALSKRLKAA